MSTGNHAGVIPGNHAGVIRCPTPDKNGYRTEREAQAGVLLGRQERSVTLRPYLCDCGLYHLTRKQSAWRAG